VWREHLRPLLPVKAAARLRGGCKALKAMVTEWPMHLRLIKAESFEAALTCFPATESLAIVAREPPAPAEESRLIEWVRGHGGTLRRVLAAGDGATRLLSSHVRAGALPKLANISLSLQNPIHREILSGGMLGLLKQVHVTIKPGHEAQIAALEHLRHLPRLQTIRLEGQLAQETAFPPFIPPSLKSLILTIGPPVHLQSVLQGLPSILQASGASLDELQVYGRGEPFAECGAALARVLHLCSSTLKGLTLWSSWGRVLGIASIPSLLPGLLSCRATLEVLQCPWAVFSALPATCPAFPRLAMLCFYGEPNEDIDLASPAWEVMANGRLPALATLRIGTGRKFLFPGHEAGGTAEGAGRLVRASEAVAGTLRRLDLSGHGHGLGGEDLPPGACYELGAAIGKLRRLRSLDLELFSDGRAYHAVGRGMAASGGCPELVGLHLKGLSSHIDWLTCEPSLIVPSVRRLWIDGRCTGEEALLWCCGLVQAGYKYRLSNCLVDPDSGPFPWSLRACMRAIVCGGGMST
jgi:hypothetical protein